MIKEFIIAKLPTDFCHASTVIETPDGLLSCWFGGTHEGEADVAIWSSRKINGDERDIVSDEILYQWFKYTSNDEDEDMLIEGANEATYVVPGGETATSGIFYCRVGNKVKGEIAYSTSDHINVIRA